MNNYSEKIDDRYLHSEITGKILQGFYSVLNEIGYGFGIDVYKKALFIEFQNLALNCESDKALKIEYKGEKIGEFNVDILVEQKVLVMLISQEKIIQKHKIQLSNQLKNSEIEVGLLLNFFIEGEHKRKYYSNSLKRTDST